jgi:pimeloyl-ACP methyl ester carboxylesterase
MANKKNDTGESGYAPVNGIRMYYEIHGNGDMPLVLVHGGGSTIDTSFGQLLPLLSDRRRIIAVELQAHGRTTDRDSPESFGQDADDVAGLLRHLGVRQADLLGFSNGGSTVMQVAIRHADLARRIVVMSGAYRRDGFVPGFFDGFSRATLEDMPIILREAFLKINPDKAKLQRMFDLDVARMKGFTDWNDEEIRSIKAPALVISSDRDVVTPEHSARIARLIPGSQLVILPGSHGSIVGAMEAGVGSGYADIVARLVEEFLR